MNTWNWCVNSTKSVDLRLSLELPPRHEHLFGHLKNVAIVSGRLLQYTGRLRVAITLGELYASALGQRVAQMQSLLDLLNDLTVLDVDVDVARRLGKSKQIFSTPGFARRAWIW